MKLINGDTVYGDGWLTKTVRNGAVYLNNGRESAYSVSGLENMVANNKDSFKVKRAFKRYRDAITIT